MVPSYRSRRNRAKGPRAPLSSDKGPTAFPLKPILASFSFFRSRSVTGKSLNYQKEAGELASPGPGWGRAIRPPRPQEREALPPSRNNSPPTKWQLAKELQESLPKRVSLRTAKVLCCKHKPLFARRKPDRKVLKLPEQGRRAHSPGPGWGRATKPPALIAEVRDDTKLAGCDPPCKDPISYAGKLASGWGRELQPHELPNEQRSEK
jgi:hypothetical protein